MLSTCIVSKYPTLNRESGKEEAMAKILFQKHPLDHHGNFQNVRDFPSDPVVKNSPSNAGSMGSIPGWGTSHAPTCLGATREKPTCYNKDPVQPKLKKKKKVKENRFINIRQGGLRNQKENITIIFASVKRSDCTEFTCKLKKSNTLNGKGLVDTEKKPPKGMLRQTVI